MAYVEDVPRSSRPIKLTAEVEDQVVKAISKIQQHDSSLHKLLRISSPYLFTKGSLLVQFIESFAAKAISLVSQQQN